MASTASSRAITRASRARLSAWTNAAMASRTIARRRFGHARQGDERLERRHPVERRAPARRCSTAWSATRSRSGAILMAVNDQTEVACHRPVAHDQLDRPGGRPRSRAGRSTLSPAMTCSRQRAVALDQRRGSRRLSCALRPRPPSSAAASSARRARAPDAFSIVALLAEPAGHVLLGQPLARGREQLRRSRPPPPAARGRGTPSACATRAACCRLCVTSRMVTSLGQLQDRSPRAWRWRSGRAPRPARRAAGCPGERGEARGRCTAAAAGRRRARSAERLEAVLDLVPEVGALQRASRRVSSSAALVLARRRASARTARCRGSTAGTGWPSGTPCRP